MKYIKIGCLVAFVGVTVYGVIESVKITKKITKTMMDMFTSQDTNKEELNKDEMTK